MKLEIRRRPDGDWIIILNDKRFQDRLAWDEMFAAVARITMPSGSDPNRFLRTPAEHREAAQRHSFMADEGTLAICAELEAKAIDTPTVVSP